MCRHLTGSLWDEIDDVQTGVAPGSEKAALTIPMGVCLHMKIEKIKKMSLLIKNEKNCYSSQEGVAAHPVLFVWYWLNKLMTVRK